MWPLGELVGRVGKVSGAPGSYDASVTDFGGHLAVYRATDHDGTSHLVVIRSRACYIDYISDS